jgi:hypothetical protein
MAWRLAEEAFDSCTALHAPASMSIPVFKSSSKALTLYEEEKDNETIYNVRLVGKDGGKVPVAAVDLARCSEWFRAYLRNR